MLLNASQSQVPRIAFVVEMESSGPALFDRTTDSETKMTRINFDDICFRYHFAIGARKQT